MSTPIHQPDDFGEYLREAIGSLGLTVERVRAEYGISLQKNVLGQERVTREKLDRLLAALPFDAGTKADIESRYEGQAKDTIESVVIAGIRRHTQELFAEKAGVSTSALTYILHGDPRRRQGKELHEVKWQTWQKIAGVMNVHEFDQHLLWRKHAKTVLAEDGQTDPLGTEIELLLARRPDASMHKWRSERPESFKGMTTRAFQAFIQQLRAGEELPWRQVQALLTDLGADTVETVGIAAAWVQKVRELEEAEEGSGESLGLSEARGVLMATRLQLIKDVAARRPKVEHTKKAPRRIEEVDAEEVSDFESTDDEEEEVDVVHAVEHDDTWDEEEAAEVSRLRFNDF